MSESAWLDLGLTADITGLLGVQVELAGALPGK